MPDEMAKAGKKTPHATRNALDSNAKSAAISLLSARVSDSIDFALVVKQAHWNLRGKQFIAVHEMLDKLRADTDDYVDTMAERIVQLGGVAYGTVQTVARSTALPAYPTDIFPIEDHLKELSSRLASIANAVRGNIDDADEAGDPTTADVFTEVSRGLDKWLWFLEAHIAA
jgi:starvation-inducible DNA-binding protein